MEKDNLHRQKAVRESKRLRKIENRLEEKIDILRDLAYTECDHLREYDERRISKLIDLRKRVAEVRKIHQEKIITG